MKYLFLFIIITIFLNSHLPPGEMQEVVSILYKHNIDIDDKSYKGWIRLLNSKERLIEYNYDFTNKEKEILLEYFKIKLKYRKERILK